MREDFIKIINETYKVIDFFPDSEPLKGKIKEKLLIVLEDLTLIFGAEGWISLKKEKAVAEFLDNVEILENYLKLSKYQGLIDNINFLIIQKEYQKIKDVVGIPKGNIKESLKMIPEVVAELKEEPLIKKLPELKEIIKKTEASSSKDLSDRQNKILDILSRKEKAQVSDIIKEIPKVTKRTIRRDLDDLLKRGKIVRVGEWNQVFYKPTQRSDQFHLS